MLTRGVNLRIWDNWAYGASAPTYITSWVGEGYSGTINWATVRAILTLSPTRLAVYEGAYKIIVLDTSNRGLSFISAANVVTIDATANVSFKASDKTTTLMTQLTPAGSGVVASNLFGLSNSADFVGTSDETASASATIKVNTTGSVAGNQSGLTAGTSYYVTGVGALTTADTDVPVGFAVSSSDIVIAKAVV